MQYALLRRSVVILVGILALLVTSACTSSISGEESPPLQISPTLAAPTPDEGSEGPASPALKTFSGAKGIPIVVSYPGDWFAGTGAGFHFKPGVTIVNDRHERPNVLTRRDNDFFGTHIRSAVAVTILKAPNHRPSSKESSFPLDMADAKVDSGWGRESVRYLNAQVAGTPIRITIYAAKGASRQDIAAADAIVASIRPLTLTGPPVSSSSSVTVQSVALRWYASESSTAIAASNGYAWVSGDRHSFLAAPDGSAIPLPFDQGPNDLSASTADTWATGFEQGVGDYIARFPPGSAEPDLTVPLRHLGVSTIEATDSAVWVFGYERGGSGGNLGTLVRVDPTTGSVVNTLVLKDFLPHDVATDLAMLYDASADAEAVWLLIADVQHGELGQISLVRVDAQTYDAATYNPGRISKIVAGGDAVWLPGQEGPVRLDPATGETMSINVPDPAAAPFAVTSDAVWLIGGSPTQVRLFRVGLDVNGLPETSTQEFDAPRGRLWGYASPAYDAAGSVSVLYETGQLQQVLVGDG